MIPCEVSFRFGLGRKLGIESSGRESKRDLNNDVRGFVIIGDNMVEEVGVFGTLSAPTPMFRGKALSFALRLKNKKSGASQTQTPKNVAISANPGTVCAGIR